MNILKNISKLIQKAFATDVVEQKKLTKKPKQIVKSKKPLIGQSNAIKVYIHQLANGEKIKYWSPSRIMYKAAQLNIKGIEQEVLALAQRSTNKDEFFYQYSLIYLIGKCGTLEALQEVLKHIKTTNNSAIYRVVLDAMWVLNKEKKNESLIKDIVDHLPATIKKCIENKETPNREEIDKWSEMFVSPNNVPVLFLLYYISDEVKELRTLVVQLLARMPLKFPHFAAFRQVLKSAEFRNDFEVLGLMTRRLEQSKTIGNAAKVYYKENKHWKYGIRWQESGWETITFNNSTKAYFSKRFIRNLYLLTNEQSEHYIAYASSILKGYNDHMITGRPVKESTWEYNRTRRNWTQKVEHFIVFDKPVATALLLDVKKDAAFDYAQGGLSLKVEKSYYEGLETKDLLPHKDLWLKHPSYSVAMLAEAKSSIVANLAIEVIEAQANKETLITKALLVAILKNGLPVSVDFALKYLPSVIDIENPDQDLVEAMLSSENKMVRAQMYKWANENELYFEKDYFLNALVNSNFSDGTKFLKEQATRFKIESEQLYNCYKAALYQLLNEPNENNVVQRIKHIKIVFKAFLIDLNKDFVQKLLKHSFVSNQILAADILLLNKAKIDEYPTEWLLDLMQSEVPELRAKGMQLYSSLPLDILKNKLGVLVSLAVSDKPELRQHVGPAIDKIVKSDETIGPRLLDFFLPILLKKERLEGLHTDIRLLIEQTLGAFLPKMEEQTILKLTISEYEEANTLGSQYLHLVNWPNQDLSMITTLANHEMRDIREFAYTYFNENKARIKYEKEKALKILDADWDSTRAFGCEYFSTNFSEKEWNPALLVSICDSNRLDIQTFGEQLVKRFFKAENGGEYLLKLSEHPSLQVQTFASQYLQEFATDNPSKFKALQLYFRTILIQLYKGGTVKKRLFEFFKNEGLKSEPVAKTAIEILKDVVLTIGIRDKADCLKTLHILQKKYPHLESGMKILVPEVR